MEISIGNLPTHASNEMIVDKVNLYDCMIDAIYHVFDLY